ncbi:hypothetical protein BJ170DRAFT_60068 [Xylariales sp. AK1849]|nr:hypothetical protein BJ170DRAFT_60068 [Xylariales sp. AK1849]
MHRTLSSRWLSTALRTTERSRALDLPVFLCPTLACRHYSSKVLSRKAPSKRLTWKAASRSLHGQAEAATSGDPSEAVKPVRKLPAQCTGCGALSQILTSDQPGYYDMGRKVVRRYLGMEQPRSRRPNREREEDEIFQKTVESLDAEELAKHGVDIEEIAPSLAPEPVPETNYRHRDAPIKAPLCDRCHNLLHHETGVSIYHPTIDSIRDTLAESPYKYNHVYHVLDAADFPMSILPQIHLLLDLMPIRTKNRRSRAGKFYHGQQTEMSFIITRSDLLAPTKTQVDHLVPYLREVLRDALGRAGSNVRLGNIRCVSARRSWWTKELKEDIWKRGGAGWMVGKVNVGKSQLFEAVFPKGRMDWDPTGHQITVDMYARDGKKELPTPEADTETQDAEDELIAKLDESKLDEYSLLPPAPPETQYPEMPLVSDLPGTTASPIRVPFGNGRGELIDLPGVERTGLEKYVKEEHRPSLVLRSRVIPEQMVLKQGQSLLLGGFIRITPRVPGPIVMTYAFTPIKPHMTNTEKAIAIQEQTSDLNVESIAAPGTGEKTKLAGSFELKWDVTKARAGPITANDAVAIRVERLPYRVLAADILIEGVGWVEVVAQVRTKDLYGMPRVLDSAVDAEPVQPEHGKELSSLERLEALMEDPRRKKTSQPPAAKRTEGEPNWPVVDVYSPEGKFIGCRRPMNGWLNNKPRVTAASTKSRPRKSMKGVKKLEKTRRRETGTAS